MQTSRLTLCHGAGYCARLGLRPAVGSVGVLLTLPRGCQLACSFSARSSLHHRGGSDSLRRGRREIVVCNAAAKNFYELLGVSQSASDREVKSAYRKLAMKLHPDVNKAPDAQKRFMEVKVAYETLSDSKQRSEYDRRLRMGGYSGYGGRTGGGSSSASSGSYGGAAGGAGWGSYRPYGTGANFTQEPVPGLDELVRELEKEFTAWANSRNKGGKEKSLMDELEDLGGELLDFLEESLGIKDDSPAASSAGASSSQGAARDTRSAAERFDDIWRLYGDGSAPGSGASSSNKASGDAGGGHRSGASTTTDSTTSSRPGGASSSSPSSSSSKPPRQGAGRPDEDDIDAQLQALKRKLNKL